MVLTATSLLACGDSGDAADALALTEILDKTAATHYGGGTSKPSDSSTSSDDGEDFRRTLFLYF